MPSDKVTPIVRMIPYDPFELTWEQYEEVRRDVVARATACCTELGDAILAGLLTDQYSRYLEVKQQLGILSEDDYMHADHCPSKYGDDGCNCRVKVD